MLSFPPDTKAVSAERFVLGYLTIAGFKKPEVRIQTTTSPLSVDYEWSNKNGAERTGYATCRIPDAVQVELNRAAARKKPYRKEIVNEIDRANRLGGSYTPDNEKVAAELREHFQRRNGDIIIQEEDEDIGALVEGN